MADEHHRHGAPQGLKPALDIRVPPADPWAARNYADLVALWEELGHALDGGLLPADDFRRWESRVAAMLRAPESDGFMRRRIDEDDPAFDFSQIQEERYQNLKDILMARKGLKRR